MAVPAAPDAADDPLPASGPDPLRVRLYDPYRLISKEVRQYLEDEVVSAFARSGVGIRFANAGGSGVIPATLYPELPERWGVPPEAMGVAIGTDAERRSVFLSLGAAERALGWRRPRGPRAGTRQKRRPGLEPPRARRLGIALGRVLAHELTHSIAPSCPHTRSGLMAAQLSRKMLTAPGIAFDGLAARHLRRRASTFGAPQSG